MTCKNRKKLLLMRTPQLSPLVNSAHGGQMSNVKNESHIKDESHDVDQISWSEPQLKDEAQLKEESQGPDQTPPQSSLESASESADEIMNDRELSEVAEVSISEDVNGQLTSAMKRIEELEQENAVLRAKLEQTTTSQGVLIQCCQHCPRQKSLFVEMLNDERNPKNADGSVRRPLGAVREQIYEYAFVTEGYLGGQAQHTRDFKKHLRHLWQESFSVSCRQIYFEVRPVFLGMNGFEFNFIKPFWEFLQIIGTKGRRLVKRLRFNFCGGSPFRVLRYLTSCTELQSLQISIVVKMNRKRRHDSLREEHQLSLEAIRSSSFRCGVLNALDCFVGEEKDLLFGDFRGYERVTIEKHWTPEMAGEGERIQKELSTALRKVKAELRGLRVRVGLEIPPSVDSDKFMGPHANCVCKACERYFQLQEEWMRSAPADKEDEELIGLSTRTALVRS